MTMRQRAYTVIVLSIVSGILLLVSFLIYVLPVTPYPYSVAGWGVLVIFEITLALSFVSGCVSLDKTKHPENYK